MEVKAEEPTLKHEPSSSEHSHTSIVLYFGPPALGKSYFADYINVEAKKHNVVMSIVSIDQVSLPIIEAAKKAHPEKKMWELYAEKMSLINSSFEEEVRKTLDDVKDPLNLVIVDAVKINDKFFEELTIRVNKDLDPAHHNDSVEHDKKHHNLHIKHHLTVIYPKIAHEQKIPGYPFSAQLLMNLCYRALKREGHETLTSENYSDEEKIRVVLNLTNKYKNMSCIKTAFHRAGNVKFVEVEFHLETPDGKGASSPKLIQQIYAQIEVCLTSLDEEEAGKKSREESMRSFSELLGLINHFKQDEALRKQHLGFGRANTWGHAIDTMLNPLKEGFAKNGHAAQELEKKHSENSTPAN
jgi:hypothetical protein